MLVSTEQQPKGHTVYNTSRFTTFRPMSEAQQRFISDLLNKRDIPANVLDLYREENVLGLSTKSASGWIDKFKSYALRPTAPAEPATPFAIEYAEALAAVPNSKYAIPTEALVAFPRIRTYTNDLLFLEVKSMPASHGRPARRVIYRLTGAPGGYSRSLFTHTDALGLLKFIAGRHVEFALNYGKHWACCGKCGAALTDERSRAAFFGPECAKMFGIAW